MAVGPAILEVELNPGRANRARINRSPLPRPREIIGVVRTVVFAPDDLTLVKGDPSDRRKFLDDLLILRAPRLAGVRSDYDRILKQRNSLLKTAGLARGDSRETALVDACRLGPPARRRSAPSCSRRDSRLVDELRPYVGKAYEAVARGASRDDAEIDYKSSFDLPDDPADLEADPPRRARAPAQGRARPRDLPGRPAPRRAGADPGQRRAAAAGQGLRVARGVVVLRVGVAAGVVRPAARRRRRPDPGARRRLRRARHRAPRRSSPSWSPAPSRCWSPPRSPRMCPRPCRGCGSWSPTGRYGEMPDDPQPESARGAASDERLAQDDGLDYARSAPQGAPVRGRARRPSRKTSGGNFRRRTRAEVVRRAPRRPRPAAARLGHVDG